MAELNVELNAAQRERQLAPGSWTQAQTRAQFGAIAWLRWRMLVNGLRRKGGTGELVGRIILFPMLAGLAIGPSIGVGIGGFIFAHDGKLDNVKWLLWGTFAFCQLLNIQLGQPGSTFDPTELIRFPLSGRTYVYIRLCFGLLSPANVIGTLMSGSIALGVMLAAPPLWLYAALGLATFALANVLFSRMIFAWVDRWLSTRRAREIFTGLIFAFSLGIQWANFTFNPAYNHHKAHTVSPQSVQLMQSLFQHVQPYLKWLPPQLTASSLVAARRGDSVLYLELTAGCAAYAAAFFLVFAMRMRKEFLGESLSDAANGVAKTASPAKVRPTAVVSASERTFGLPPVLFGILGKELLYVRRNTGIFAALIMPVFIVLMVVSKFATHSNASWIFPAAVAYSLLAISALSYNSFGFEGTGVQLYFLAPVRLRDVMLAKNLLNFLIAFLEIALTFAIITYAAGMPSPVMAVVTVLWAGATLMISTLVGNLRSITTPKRINTQRMANKQVSQVSALIGMGILMASSLMAAVPIGLAVYFHKTWPLLPLFLVFAGAALYFYERSLRSIDAFAMEHRDELFEELCKSG
jgi:ABC-2 type transport system permease protein